MFTFLLKGSELSHFAQGPRKRQHITAICTKPMPVLGFSECCLTVLSFGHTWLILAVRPAANHRPLWFAHLANPNGRPQNKTRRMFNDKKPMFRNIGRCSVLGDCVFCLGL